MPIDQSDERPPRKRGRKPTFKWREAVFYVQAMLVQRMLVADLSRMPKGKEICARIAAKGGYRRYLAGDRDALEVVQKRKKLKKSVASIRIESGAGTASTVRDVKTLQNIFCMAKRLMKSDEMFASMVALMLESHGIYVDVPTIPAPVWIWRPPHRMLAP